MLKYSDTYLDFSDYLEVVTAAVVSRGIGKVLISVHFWYRKVNIMLLLADIITSRIYDKVKVKVFPRQ